jgi:hypothetical protein
LLFKRKKHKDPGSYGTYEKIDLNDETKEEKQTELPPAATLSEPISHSEPVGDYTDDEDLASLEQLIKRIKKKAQQPPLRSSSEEIEDDLEQLREQDSSLESSEIDPNAESAGTLLSSRSFIQGLESDLIGEQSAAPSVQKQVEKTLERLLDDILRLNDAQRQEIITSDVFKSFLSLLAAEEKDVTDEHTN